MTLSLLRTVLTPTEAIEQAKEEQAPYWIGLEPQLFVLQTESRTSTVLPLSSEFSQKFWFILFVDPTSHEGHYALQKAKQFSARYGMHQLHFLFIFSFAPELLQRQPTHTDVHKMLSQLTPTYCFDHDLSLSKAFQVKTAFHLILMDCGMIKLQASNPIDLQNTEQHLHHLLRQKDPGLAFFPVYEPSAFVRNLDWIPLTQPYAGLSLNGNWIIEASRITTADPMATITLTWTGNCLSLFAQALEDRPSPMMASVDVKFNESNANPPLTIQLLTLNLYPIFSKPESQLDHHDLVFHFPHANVSPVALYGIRIGQWTHATENIEPVF